MYFHSREALSVMNPFMFSRAKNNLQDNNFNNFAITFAPFLTITSKITVLIISLNMRDENIMRNF